MALIRFPEGQQRSGSLGGTVYSRNRYGAYIRARSIPVNPNTDRQVAVRNVLRNLSIAWENVLSPEERAKWDEYASNVVWKNRLGDSVKLTGASHYLRSNLPYFLAFATTLAKAPDIFNLAASEAQLRVTAAESVQAIVVAFDDSAEWCSEDGAYQVAYMGLPQNANIKFFLGQDPHWSRRWEVERVRSGELSRLRLVGDILGHRTRAVIIFRLCPLCDERLVPTGDPNTVWAACPRGHGRLYPHKIAVERIELLKGRGSQR
jgi:hypothetical protein